MKREVYEALRMRIWIVEQPEILEEVHSMYPDTSEDATIYRFDNTGLNDGIDTDDEGYIDSIVHPMNTLNKWNVCQRFYSFLKWYPDIDERLLAHQK